MLADAERTAAADALKEASAAGVPILPLTETFEKFDVVDAYEVQLINVRRRTEAGALVRGHKVGLSAKAMQQMLGVHEPDYGHLLDNMFFYEGDVIPMAGLIQPRVEIEVAFVLGAPLKGPGVTVADVLRATAYVCPSIEVVDSRIEGWKLTIADTIADNASSGVLVLGGRPTGVADVDLRTI